MHTTTNDAARLAKAVVDAVGLEKDVVMAICPPFTYLALVGAILKGSQVSLGAQNLYPEKEGAFTGEISPTMLLDVGCKYVILGHSERRHILGETDGFINQKVLIALASSLNVILCVGETLDQRKTKQTEAVLDRQLVQGLAGLSADTLPMNRSGRLEAPDIKPHRNRFRRRTPLFVIVSARCSGKMLPSHFLSNMGAASNQIVPPHCSVSKVWMALSLGARA